MPRGKEYHTGYFVKDCRTKHTMNNFTDIERSWIISGMSIRTIAKEGGREVKHQGEQERVKEVVAAGG